MAGYIFALAITCIASRRSEPRLNCDESVGVPASTGISQDRLKPGLQRSSVDRHVSGDSVFPADVAVKVNAKPRGVGQFEVPVSEQRHVTFNEAADPVGVDKRVLESQQVAAVSVMICGDGSAVARSRGLLVVRAGGFRTALLLAQMRDRFCFYSMRQAAHASAILVVMMR